MMRVFMAILCSLWAVCSVSAQSNRQEGTDRQVAIYRLPLMERAFLCTRHFEGWHDQSCYPYVGYGHRLQKGESYSARTMTKRQADALLRKDLRKFISMFRNFGRDSVLLGTLAFNVGPAKLLGNGRYPKSRLIKNWRLATGTFTMSMLLSVIIKVNGTPCCLNGERRSLRCCMYHNT